MQEALAHKEYAIKFFTAWIAFVVADALWLNEMSGWLNFVTHCVLLLAAILSVIFWAYRIWRLRHGDLRDNRREK